MNEIDTKFKGNPHFLLGYSLSALGQAYRTLDLNEDHISKRLQERIKTAIFYIQESLGNKPDINNV